MTGPGKYDDSCTRVRIETKAEGAMIIIFNGEHGHGFSAQLPKHAVAGIPQVLRDVADQIERDARQSN